MNDRVDALKRMFVGPSKYKLKRPSGRMAACHSVEYKLEFKFTAGQLLLVYCFQYFTPSLNGRFGKRLTAAQLDQYLCFFKFLFVLLQGLVNIFAIFRINYQHNIILV